MDQTTSEGFGNLPNSSANFGTIPQGAEDFRTLRNHAERTDQHTLTVREVARLFEQAGVPRTERSIINWCQPNRQGIARLDAFFDSNERKYFITPQSTTLAIREEQAKASANGQIMTPPPTSTASEVPKNSERHSERPKSSSDPSEAVDDLQLKIRDLEITNRAKDYFIDQLKNERVEFQAERQKYIEHMIADSQRIGQLRSELLLGSGTRTASLPFRNDSASHGSEGKSFPMEPKDHIFPVHDTPGHEGEDTNTDDLIPDFKNENGEKFI